MIVERSALGVLHPTELRQSLVLQSCHGHPRAVAVPEVPRHSGESLSVGPDLRDGHAGIAVPWSRRLVLRS